MCRCGPALQARGVTHHGWLFAWGSKLGGSWVPGAETVASFRRTSAFDVCEPVQF